MRHFLYQVTVLGAALFLSACSGSKKLEFAKLDSAFAAAPAEVQAEVERAIPQLEQREFTQGLAALRNAARRGKLSGDQIQAIYDAIAQVQIVMSREPQTASDEAYAIIRELGRILEAQQQ